MDDPGYADYNDPRLQPPAGYFHDPTPAETYELCAHRYACRHALEQCGACHIDEGFPWIEELSQMLGCEDCEEFDGFDE